MDEPSAEERELAGKWIARARAVLKAKAGKQPVRDEAEKPAEWWPHDRKDLE